VSTDPDKLPEGAPPLPDERDTAAASQTVGDVIFELFRRHTLNFIIGVLVFGGSTFGALADEAGKLGWTRTAFLGRVLQPGCVALLAFLAKFQAAEPPKPP
jgi:hypothetical protein